MEFHDIIHAVTKDLAQHRKDDGNLKAIPILIEGWTVEDVESKLAGVLCGRRPTSCADQLAKAVRAAYDAEKRAS